MVVCASIKIQIERDRRKTGKEMRQKNGQTQKNKDSVQGKKEKVGKHERCIEEC